MTTSQLRQIFDKTGGHCHFCGDLLSFELRGLGGGAKGVHDVPAGYWEVDHIAQRQRGGAKGTANAIPACTACNRLRWHRSGRYTRTTMLLGLVAREFIRQGGSKGTKLLVAAAKRWPQVAGWPVLGERKKKRKP